MAKKTVKIRTKTKGGITTVKALLSHKMESGFRKDKKGGMIPAHFIEQVTCTIEGKTVMTAYWSGGVSKNPYIAFQIPEAMGKGKKLTLNWVDNKGGSGSGEAAIK